MDSSMPLNHLIGILFVTVLGMSLVSYLLYSKCKAAGASTGRIKSSIISIWMSVIVALTVLFSLRAVIGGPLVDASVSMRSVETATMDGGQWAAFIVGIFIILLCMRWATGTVRSLVDSCPGPDNNGGSDEN